MASHFDDDVSKRCPPNKLRQRRCCVFKTFLNLKCLAFPEQKKCEHTCGRISVKFFVKTQIKLRVYIEMKSLKNQFEIERLRFVIYGMLAWISVKFNLAKIKTDYSF